MERGITCISGESSAGSIRRIGDFGSKNLKSQFSPFSTDFSGKTIMNEILGLGFLNMMSGSKIPILQLFVHYHEKTGKKKSFSLDCPRQTIYQITSKS